MDLYYHKIIKLGEIRSDARSWDDECEIRSDAGSWGRKDYQRYFTDQKWPPVVPMEMDCTMLLEHFAN